MKPELSVLLMAHNEEARLPGFFRALKALPLALEIVVIEHGSRDRTAALARRHGARLVNLPWQGFSATKNRGMAYCRAPWILSLDADEYPGPELCRAIAQALRRPDFPAYALCRTNYFLGRPIRHGGWYPDWQLRLFKKGSARFNQRLVHEGMEMKAGLQAGRLQGELSHFSYPSLASYMERLNRYTSLQAEELFSRKGARPGLALARMVFDPPATFLKMILLKGGFLDGGAGWMVAALSASSTFWKYAKWWFLSFRARGGEAGTPWVLRQG